MLTKTQSTKVNFSGERIYVGIDTHKKNWSVALYHNETSMRTFTQESNPQVLVNYLKKNYPGADFHCAYEAGFCGFWIQKYLTKAGLHCIVVNPADIPTTHKEKEFKADPRDCRKIAKSLRSNLLEPIYIPSDHGIEYRKLVRYYHDKSNNSTRYKNKIKGLLNFYGIHYPPDFESVNSHWSRSFYAWLQAIKLNNEFGDWTLQSYVTECLRAKELKRIATAKVRELSKTALFKKHIELLRTIPGVGLITAMTIITEIEDIRRFKNLDKFCSYIGLIPSTDSSGEKERIGEITKRGNKFLKNVIIESAWMAIRRDPDLFHTYVKRKNNMDSNKAIIRVARKLVARIRYVLINEKPYIIKENN
jgi:transposase